VDTALRKLSDSLFNRSCLRYSHNENVVLRLTWSVQAKSFHFHLLSSILIRHLFTVSECRRNSHSLEGATESLLTVNTKFLN